LRQFLASVPRGFADLLARELIEFGALDVRERGNAVAFTGTLEVAYRACLSSWTASRIYVEVLRFEAYDDAEIYAALRAIDWTVHINPQFTLACEWSGKHPAISNTHFGTLRLKDAICDSLRDSTGIRPDIATQEPGVRVHAHAVGTKVTVSIDLAGEGLHRRGWRAATGEAPLRENVAGGILLRAMWPMQSASGAPFLDPMCGSGTFVIEAARMAAGFSANQGRNYFGFQRWQQHDVELWQQVYNLALTRSSVGLEAMRAQPPKIFGCDHDARAIRVARENASYAGVSELVRFEVSELGESRPFVDFPAGLLCTNPPWGIRLGDDSQARAVHAQLGEVLRTHFIGWRAAVLTGDASLGLELGLRASRVHTVYNGGIECRLLRIEVATETIRDLRPRQESRINTELTQSPGAVMFGNRITKNLKKLAAWARRESVSCCRIYDADMPEYSFAIDQYTTTDKSSSASGLRWLVMQEYMAPADIPEESLRKRRGEAFAGLILATGIAREQIQLRTRRRNKRGEQYTKRDQLGEYHVVIENELQFRVNFGDYLDTGLFLDHRSTRMRLRNAAHGKRFLNLFSYTGSATVYAAAGGASATTAVDLSATYLDWSRSNLALNGFDHPQHIRIQADVRNWLRESATIQQKFDLIFCDPPTFSNSKRMQGIFDVQRDHADLIEECMAVLAPEGLLLFSTNSQKFRLDDWLPTRYDVRDITKATIPIDFFRNTHIHQCFEVRIPTTGVTPVRATAGLTEI